MSASSGDPKRPKMDSNSPEASSSSSTMMNKQPEVDNSSTVINKIANLYAERLMSDVILEVGTQEFPSHRLILCASSDVFQIMLMNPNWSESQGKRVQLVETPSGEAVFEDFLKYLYTGKILLDYATVIPLVGLADKYNVRDLLRLGLDYMARNVPTACKRNQVVSWYQFASAAGHKLVSSLCGRFIAANFEKISDNVDFPNMEPEVLLHFLRKSDLVIADEMALFKCVDKWLTARREMMERAGEEHIDVHMNRYVDMLLPHVRFPMMTPAQLANLLLNPLSKTHTGQLVEIIRLAMHYHQNFASTQSIDPEFEGLYEPRLFTPRLYTAENFCASLSINNFAHLSNYASRSLLFTAQRHTSESLGSDEQAEWVVEVFPKGVCIPKCLTVYRPPGLEVPEVVLKTVRVSLSTKSEDDQRVHIGVLLQGEQDGFVHVRKVLCRNYYFSADDQILNFDDVADFDELRNLKEKSKFLCGPNKDTLKVLISLTPLTKLSCREIS